MSEQMAVNDNALKEEREDTNDEALVEGTVETAELSLDVPFGEHLEKSEETPKTEEEMEEDDTDAVTSEDVKLETKEKVEETPIDNVPIEAAPSEDDKRGVKRRASTALSDVDEIEEFKGFDEVNETSLVDYNKAVERLEAEVTEAVKSLTPLRSVRASSITLVRASKRARQDTDGSRPSSALSSRSDGDGAASTDASMSPLAGGGGGGVGRGRRSTVEMSSPMLRVPLERGWKRELVYRAALDAHSRRNADIYYYTPAGKKLRSTREVAEQLSGTGLTLDNFSFFKEPLGIDDPEKEIIRDAKVMRRVESPVPSAAPPAEGKRTPKPKPPKGVSPEPPTAAKSPSAKLKVKSVGSRLNNNGATPTAVTPKQTRKPLGQQPAQPAATAAAPATAIASTPATTASTPTTPAATPTTADNNNSTAWKKPRPAPPALTSRPPSAPVAPQPEPPRQLVQPCSMTCGRGVPSLACVACLCLYHPACVGFANVSRDNFYCKNCRKTSPPLEPPPLTHKTGVTTASVLPASAPPPAMQSPGISNAPPRRLPVPVPVPVPVPRGDKRVLLRMKVAGGGPDGSRLWAVTKGPASASPAATAPTPSTTSSAPAVPAKPASAPPAPVQNPSIANARPSLPQSLAVLNGRRFIVVPRAEPGPDLQPPIRPESHSNFNIQERKSL